MLKDLASAPCSYSGKTKRRRRKALPHMNLQSRCSCSAMQGLSTLANLPIRIIATSTQVVPSPDIRTKQGTIQVPPTLAVPIIPAPRIHAAAIPVAAAIERTAAGIRRKACYVGLSK
jgi:hypothetical protein